jgi:hypothetical protein
MLRRTPDGEGTEDASFGPHPLEKGHKNPPREERILSPKAARYVRDHSLERPILPRPPPIRRPRYAVRQPAKAGFASTARYFNAGTNAKK